MVQCVCWKQSLVCCAWLLRLCVCHSSSAATALVHAAFIKFIALDLNMSDSGIPSEAVQRFFNEKLFVQYQ